MAKKLQYRVRNWQDYNRALVNRGDVTLWINEDVVEKWYWDGVSAKAGSPRIYADLAIECALSLRSLFHLPLRATQGFLRSILAISGVNLSAPDYSTISRRAALLSIDLGSQRAAGEHVIIVVDATGLKVYGEGEWKIRTHGKDKRRSWRKLHLAINRKTHLIEAARLTASNRHDCEETEALMNEVGTCDRVIADGAYDNDKSYSAIDNIGARALIPPRSGAALTPHLKRKPISWGMVQRNSNIHGVWRLGRKEWKKATGYHQRSLAETGIGRFKTIFGPGLKSRAMARQVAEARIKCRVMNRLTELGMPRSERLP